MNEESLKIGMYTENEIFKYMTEQEGGMLGRSMYDAVFNKIHNLITENQQLKDLIVEKNNQLKDMQSQHTDYTQVNILKMKLEKSEKARKKSIELLSIIYSISVDYDGFNDVAGLKQVIDDMARYIKKAKVILDIDKGE